MDGTPSEPCGRRGSALPRKGNRSPVPVAWQPVGNCTINEVTVTREWACCYNSIGAAYAGECRPGWHLIVPFVDRSIFLPLSEFVPGWEGYGEEQLRQKLVHDFYQTVNRDVPAGVGTEASGPAVQPYLSPGERLLAFAFFFGLGVVAFIVELKTGYHVDRDRSRWSITQVHGPWSWDEVWTHLPDELSGLIFLPVCVLSFVVVELWCRFDAPA